MSASFRDEIRSCVWYSFDALLWLNVCSPVQSSHVLRSVYLHFYQFYRCILFHRNSVFRIPISYIDKFQAKVNKQECLHEWYLLSIPIPQTEKQNDLKFNIS